MILSKTNHSSSTNITSSCLCQHKALVLVILCLLILYQMLPVCCIFLLTLISHYNPTFPFVNKKRNSAFVFSHGVRIFEITLPSQTNKKLKNLQKTNIFQMLKSKQHETMIPEKEEIEFIPT